MALGIPLDLEDIIDDTDDTGRLTSAENGKSPMNISYFGK